MIVIEGEPVMDKLESYKNKRDFTQTNEPLSGKQQPGGQPRFVVQKHNASHLHYDFRLEVDGVLASWAVPKGPSTDPSEKRLAVRTEDHPLDYAAFEGTIPEGQYGAGEVEIWDKGTYQNLKDIPISEALEKGHITFHLQGDKLKGGYALTRTGQGKNWLMVKMREKG